MVVALEKCSPRIRQPRNELPGFRSWQLVALHSRINSAGLIQDASTRLYFFPDLLPAFGPLLPVRLGGILYGGRRGGCGGVMLTHSPFEQI
jgi:hypothetical protein